LDIQYRFGDLHYAYLAASDARSPVPLGPVDGSPVPPGGSRLPRLLWALRHPGARAPRVDPAFVPVVRPSV